MIVHYFNWLRPCNRHLHTLEETREGIREKPQQSVTGTPQNFFQIMAKAEFEWDRNQRVHLSLFAFSQFCPFSVCTFNTIPFLQFKMNLSLSRKLSLYQKNLLELICTQPLMTENKSGRRNYCIRMRHAFTPVIETTHCSQY